MVPAVAPLQEETATQTQHRHQHQQGAAVADRATSLAFVLDGLRTADEALLQEVNLSIPFAAAHAVAVQQPHQHQHQLLHPHQHQHQQEARPAVVARRAGDHC